MHFDQFALHHRQLKSRGGKDTIQNLVALHHHCHNMGRDSVHNRPTEATRRGLMVNSWDDPLDIPVTLEDGSHVLLTAEGGYKTIEGGNNERRTNNHDHRGTDW